jgi:hypothetical protein
VLEVSASPAQGVLFLGAHRPAREIAKALRDSDIPVLLVDTDYLQAREARMDHLPVYYGNLLAEHAEENLDLDGLGKLLAITPNDGANSLASIHLAELFGRSETYQLAPEEASLPGIDTTVPIHLRGRTLFARDTSFSELEKKFREGARIKRTTISKEFGMDDYEQRYGSSALPLFLVDGNNLSVFAADNPPTPKPGQTIIALVNPEEVEETKNSDTTAAPNQAR